MKPVLPTARSLRLALLPFAYAILAIFSFRHVNDAFVVEDLSFPVGEARTAGRQTASLKVAVRPGESYLVTTTGSRGRRNVVRHATDALLKVDTPSVDGVRSVRVRNYAVYNSNFPVTYVLFDDSSFLGKGTPAGTVARLAFVAAFLLLLHILGGVGLWRGLAGTSLRIGLEREAAFPLVAAVVPGLLLLASFLSPYHIVWDSRNFLLFLCLASTFVKALQLVRHRREEGLATALGRLHTWIGAHGRSLHLGLALAFCAVLFLLALARHGAYRSGACDLALFDQITRSTFHGEAGFTAMKHETFLQEHTAFIFSLIAASYAVYDDPRTLLFLQSFFLAAAILPLSLIAEQLLGSRALGVAVSALYICSPFVWKAHLFDFHQETLVPFFFLSAFYAALRGRWILYGICAALALLCKEDMALYLAGGGLVMAFARDRCRRRAGLLTAIAGSAWFLLCMFLLLPAFSKRADHFTLAQRYGYLGDTLGAVVSTVLTRPAVLAQHLFTAGNLRTLAGLLFTVAFLPLWSLSALLVLATPLLVNILSELPEQRELGLHYSMPVLPFLYFGAILGLRRLLSSRVFLRSGGSVNLLAAALLLLGATNWIIVVSPRLTSETFVKKPRYAIADSIIATLPRDRSVSAQTTLLPHLFRHRKGYLFPDVSDADYIFLDRRGPIWPLAGEEYVEAIEGLRRNEGYEVLRDEDGFLLFGRRTAPPARSTPDQEKR